MSSRGYFIRAQGKISGPFDLPALQKLVRRGLLSRLQEISGDRRAWNRAGDVEELFPSNPVSTAPAAKPAFSTAAAAAPAAPVAEPAADPRFYYAQNGETVGPLPLPVLRVLAENGTLRPDDICWQEGTHTGGAAAGTLPALADLFATAPPGWPTAGAPVTLRAAAAPHTLAYIQAICQIFGIALAAILLIGLNLPFGVVANKTIWWWSNLNHPDSGLAAMIGYFVLFAGLAAFGFGAFAKGYLRGYVFMGLAAASFVLLCAMALDAHALNAVEFFFALIALYGLSGLVGVCTFRRFFPQPRQGAIFQAILGGLVLFGMLIGLFNQLVVSGSRGPLGELSPVPMAGWVVLAVALALAGTLAGVAAGVLGLVGVRRQFSTAVNLATHACALAGLGLPVCAAMVLAFTLATQAPAFFGGMMALLVVRVCAVGLALVAAFGAGLLEVLTQVFADANTAAARS